MGERVIAGLGVRRRAPAQALLIVSLAVTGCKKDEQQNPATNSKAQASINITNQLLSFRDKLKLKTGGSLPTDSATWYLEGLLNYENANNDHNFINLNFIHDSIVIYSGSNSISINDLNIAYDYFSSKLLQEANLHNDTSYKFDLVDIQVVNTGLKNGETVIKMAASGGFNLVGVYLAFNPVDNWYAGGNLGKCDGTNVGQDAADQLQYRFNHPAIGPPAPRGYYTSNDEYFVGFLSYPDPNYPGTWDAFMQFATHSVNNNPIPPSCISWEDLNYYLSKFDYIKGQIVPSGKTFKNVEVLFDYIGTFPNYNVGHSYYFYYGTFVLGDPIG